MSFDICIHPCSHQPNQYIGFCCSRKSFYTPFYLIHTHTPPSTSCPINHRSDFNYRLVLPILAFHINELILYIYLASHTTSVVKISIFHDIKVFEYKYIWSFFSLDLFPKNQAHLLQTPTQRTWSTKFSMLPKAIYRF